MIKQHFGQEVRLHGCDIADENFEVFYKFAELEFDLINHPYRLPYEDNMFDTVISSGVLEHVPNDFESLKEIYRILKPEGNFIIIFLPNRYSYTEFLNKVLLRKHHNRLYTVSFVKKLLLHSGFIPSYYGFHQVVPTLAGGDNAKLGKIKILNMFVQLLYKFNGFFEKLYPINRLATNIIVIGTKKTSV